MDLKSAEEFINTLSEEEREKLVGDLLPASDFIEDRLPLPLPGPQTMAYESEADIIGYGGAAGGGKSFLACLLALGEHHRTLYVRKEAGELQGVQDEIEGLLGTTDGYNSQKNIWNIPNTKTRRQIRFAGLKDPKSHQKYQGKPRDLLVLDEATNIPHYQAMFMMGWTRHENPEQRCRTLMCTNPPTDMAVGGWFIEYFSPWLDDTHPNPAKDGELRWYVMLDGEEKEVPDKTPIEDKKGMLCYPQSRTFINSRVTDYPYFLKSGYYSTLQALPEPLRSMMLEGKFLAGIEDNVWQVIPTSWIQMAQDRWTEEIPEGTLMLSCGVDVSRGGKDESIIAPLYCNKNMKVRYFPKLTKLPGKLIPDGPTLGSESMRVRRDDATMVVDAIGVGSSVVDYYASNNIKHFPFTSSKKSKEKDILGIYKMKNMRSWAWWKLREALDPSNPQHIKDALPPPRNLLADLTAPTYKILEGNIIQVESKDQIFKRLKRSTDSGDGVVYANTECYGGFDDFSTNSSAGWGSQSIEIDTTQFI